MPLDKIHQKANGNDGYGKGNDAADDKRKGKKTAKYFSHYNFLLK